MPCIVGENPARTSCCSTRRPRAPGAARHPDQNRAGENGSTGRNPGERHHLRRRPCGEEASRTAGHGRRDRHQGRPPSAQERTDRRDPRGRIALCRTGRLHSGRQRRRPCAGRGSRPAVRAGRRACAVLAGRDRSGPERVQHPQPVPLAPLESERCASGLRRPRARHRAAGPRRCARPPGRAWRVPQPAGPWSAGAQPAGSWPAGSQPAGPRPAGPRPAVRDPSG